MIRRSASGRGGAHTTTAIDTLVSIARESRNDAARVAAATALLDRGYGKPVQSFRTTTDDPSTLTDEELLAIISGLRTIEHEPSPVDLPALTKPSSGQ